MMSLSRCYSAIAVNSLDLPRNVINEQLNLHSRKVKTLIFPITFTDKIAMKS